MSNMIDALVPKMWADTSLDLLTDNLVMARLVHTDFSNDFKRFGDRVTISKPGYYEALRKTVNDDIVFQERNDTPVSVLLDRQAHVSFLIKDGERFYAKQDLIEYFMKPAIQALCVEIDHALLDLAPEFLANSYGYPGSLDVTNVKDAIIGVRNIMNNNKVPVEGRNLIWCPESELAALDLGDFTRLHTLDRENFAMRDKSLGRRYGFNHYTVQALPTETSPGGPGESTAAYDMPYLISDQVFTVEFTATVSGNHASESKVINVTYSSGQTVGTLRRFVTIGNATYCVVSSTQSGPGGSTSQLVLEQGLLEDVASGTVIYHYDRPIRVQSDHSNTNVLDVKVPDTCIPVIGQQLILSDSGYSPASFVVLNVEQYDVDGSDLLMYITIDRTMPGSLLTFGQVEINPHVGLIMGGISSIQPNSTIKYTFTNSYPVGTTSYLTVSTPVATHWVRIDCNVYKVIDTVGSTIKLATPLLTAITSGDPLWTYSNQGNMGAGDTTPVGSTEVVFRTEDGTIPYVSQQIAFASNPETYVIQSVISENNTLPNVKHTLTLDRPVENEIADDSGGYLNPQMLHKSLIATQNISKTQGLFSEAVTLDAYDGDYSANIPISPMGVGDEYTYIEVGGMCHKVSKLTGGATVTAIEGQLFFHTKNRLPVRTIERFSLPSSALAGTNTIEYDTASGVVKNQKFLLQNDNTEYAVTNLGGVGNMFIAPNLAANVSSGFKQVFNPYGIPEEPEPTSDVVTRYNLAFTRGAMALVTRPLAPPLAGTADSVIASSDKLSIRCTVKYDALRQGHIVTLDLLYGVRVLDVNQGAVLLG